MPVTAMPNGSVVMRATNFCAADRPICPQCGNVLLGRALVRMAMTLVTCDNTTRIGGKRACGKHVLLIPMPDDLVKVVGLSDDEFVKLRTQVRSLRETLRELGLLVTRT